MIFKVIKFPKIDFHQIRSQTVCKVTISLVFAFKVMIFIRLDHIVSVK